MKNSVSFENLGGELLGTTLVAPMTADAHLVGHDDHDHDDGGRVTFTGERGGLGGSFVTLDYSADPYAGTDAANGLPIWTAEEAADNLNRYEVNWTFGNYGALDDGVLTYGFWTFEEFLDSYYYELRYADGSAFNNDAFYAEAYGAFEAFTAEQEALAELSLGLWGDLIDVEFQRVDSAADADITFASVYMSPAAGAHAYFPQAEALDNYYGTTG